MLSHEARKVLLSTAAAFFPSTTFPALQMTALLVVICGSIVLYAIYQPYSRQLWNWSEALLQLVTLQYLVNCKISIDAEYIDIHCLQVSKLMGSEDGD